MNSKNKKLTELFPMLKTRLQIQEEIEANSALEQIYNSWPKVEQERFLDICTGSRGVKMLYDAYFKEILNPEYSPDRLSSLLSLLLKTKVRVIDILSNDSTRLSDETSLVITDIVVELDNKTIANIEVQRIGYAFLGERASCYSSDLLLRQYRRLRDELKANFSYKDIAPVYTIVFIENSPAIFNKYPDTYIHYFKTTSDTGLELNMLQKFIFISVDIFLKKLHNEGINNELEAWLTFLGCDEPEYIIKLITEYPEFKPMYDDLYEMCLNVERVMEMFSKELQVLDRNTVKYMIDEMQEKLDATQDKLDSTQLELDSTKAELDTTKAESDAAIASRDAIIKQLQEKIKILESN